MARQILNKSIKVGGIDIFYREAGDRKNPSLLLLHGFPTSSVMFKNLMIALSDRFYLVAPDYPDLDLVLFQAEIDLNIRSGIYRQILINLLMR